MHTIKPVIMIFVVNFFNSFLIFFPPLICTHWLREAKPNGVKWSMPLGICTLLSIWRLFSVDLLNIVLRKGEAFIYCTWWWILMKLRLVSMYSRLSVTDRKPKHYTWTCMRTVHFGYLCVCVCFIQNNNAYILYKTPKSCIK